MKRRNLLFAGVVVFLFGALVIPAMAATSGTVTFLTGGDQPAYRVDITGAVDDGSGCDLTAVVMTDGTGTITDIDVQCVPVGTGTVEDQTDWGSYESGYVATQAPVTYSLFDITAADDCDTFGENSFACGAYLTSGVAVCLGEFFYTPPGLPTGTQYSLCAALAAQFNPSQPACPFPLPSGSVVRSLPAGALAYFQPDLNSYTGFSIPAGTWYVSETSGDFSRVWIACQARLVWVPTANVR